MKILTSIQHFQKAKDSISMSVPGTSNQTNRPSVTMKVEEEKSDIKQAIGNLYYLMLPEDTISTN